MHQADLETLEFFSQFDQYSSNGFIRAQRDYFRLWQLSFTRALKNLEHYPMDIGDAVADAELLLYFFSRFEALFRRFDNVPLLHPPTVFEKLEWALKNL